jgi:hypothetical protein
VKRAEASAELRVQAKGFAPYVASVTPSSDQEIAVSLSPLP